MERSEQKIMGVDIDLLKILPRLSTFPVERLGSQPCSSGIAWIEVEEGRARFCIQAAVLRTGVQQVPLHQLAFFWPVTHPVRVLARSITWPYCVQVTSST